MTESVHMKKGLTHLALCFLLSNWPHAALAATDDIRWDFVKAFWDTDIPSGHYRYYDGMLYMLALLELSGNFQAHPPAS